jgi:hypothetical protein
MAVHVKQVLHTAMVVVGLAAFLAVAVGLGLLNQSQVVRLEVALEAQSVLSTPALHANSHQLTWRIHK